MANIYVKRGAVVEAEPFDPARTDQGVTVTTDEDGNFIAATMRSAFGPIMVREGDWIVTLKDNAYPTPAGAFAAMFEAIGEVLTQEVAA